MSDPLDLTPDPADIVRLDGETYELARAAALSLRGRARVNLLARRMTDLEKLDEPTEDDERQYRKLLLEAASFALPAAPAPLLARLDEEQLGDLVSVFFVRAAARSPRLREMRKLGIRMQVPTMPESDGASTSPASSGSTAETPSAGST